MNDAIEWETLVDNNQYMLALGRNSHLHNVITFRRPGESKL